MIRFAAKVGIVLVALIAWQCARILLWGRALPEDVVWTLFWTGALMGAACLWGALNAAAILRALIRRHRFLRAWRARHG